MSKLTKSTRPKLNLLKSRFGVMTHDYALTLAILAEQYYLDGKIKMIDGVVIDFKEKSDSLFEYSNLLEDELTK